MGVSKISTIVKNMNQKLKILKQNIISLGKLFIYKNLLLLVSECRYGYLRAFFLLSITKYQLDNYR